MMRWHTVSLAAAMSLLPLVAFAQSPAPAGGRLSIDVNFAGIRPAAGLQIYERADIQFSEIAREVATYPAMPTRGTYGVDVGYALRRRIGVAVHVSAGTFRYVAGMGVEIPSPAFFNAFGSDADLSGTMQRTERSVDLSMTWTVLERGPWRLRAAAGPTVFVLSQQMIGAITYSQAFGVAAPTNVVDITGHDVSTSRGLGVGGHLAVDLSYFFASRIGVGVVARGNLGRASIDEPLTGTSARPAVGGFFIGTGVRIRF